MARVSGEGVGKKGRKLDSPLSFFGFRSIFSAAKTENPAARSFFAPKPNGNAYYSGYISPSMDILSGKGRCVVDRGLQHSAGLQLGLNSSYLGCIEKRLLLVKATMLLVKGRSNLRV